MQKIDDDICKLVVGPKECSANIFAAIIITKGQLSLTSENLTARSPGMDDKDISQTLALSESRVYDCALRILGAYKLAGHFPTELEIVLRDLGVVDKVSYQIEPDSLLSDQRLVEFRPNDNIDADKFRQIMQLVESQIGRSSMAP